MEEKIKKLREKLRECEGLGDRLGEVQTLIDIGNVYYNCGKYQEALNHYQKSLSIAQEIGYRREEGTNLMNIGNVYLNWRKYQEALNHLQKSLSIAQEIGYRRGEGKTLMNIGNVYLNWRKYQEALDHLQKSLNIAQKIGDRQLEGKTLMNIGNVYLNCGKYQEALNHYQKSLSIAQKIGYRRGEGKTLMNIGNVYYNCGKYQEALNHYQKSLSIAQEIGERQLEGTNLGNIGNVYSAWGKYQEALNHYQKSLTITREIGDKQGEGINLMNIGRVYSAWGKYQEALNYYQKSLTIAREIGDRIGDRRGEEQNLGNIGNVYLNWGKYQEALNYYQKSLTIAREIGDRQGEEQNLGSIGNVYSSCGKYQEALNHYQKSLNIAQEIGDKQGEGTNLNNIGNVYSSCGKYQEALNHYQKSLNIAQEIGERQLEGTNFMNIGNVYKNQAKFDKAISCFQKSIEIQDLLAVSAHSSEIRRSARVSMMETLAGLIPCLLANNQLELALAYIEHNKGREMVLERSDKKKELNPQLAKLTDQITIVDENLQKTAREYIQLEEVRKKQELSPKELEDKLQRLKIQEKQLKDERSALQHRIWEDFPTQGTALPAEPKDLIIDFQKEMPPNWIILDYFYDRIQHAYIVFIIQKNEEIQLFRNKVDPEEQQQLNQTILKIHNTVGSIDRDEVEEELRLVGKKLYELLIPKNLANYLQNAAFEYLTIIPTGNMHSYPLELLHDNENYWGLKYSMTRAFNLQTLRAALYARKEKKKAFALLVGNPTANMTVPISKIHGEGSKGMKDASLKIISEDLVELDSLLQNKGYITHRLPEEDANESIFLSMLNENPYTLIHFAGHALFNSKNPNYSYLLLKEGDETSELYANEIPVKAVLAGNPLVNLIACETGGLETELGDEVFGLARGFIEAGALSIIISGWIVFELYASRFFKSFYEHYITMKLPISESLRLARLHIQHLIHTQDEGHRHPGDDLELLHWGSYRYYGLPF